MTNQPEHQIRRPGIKSSEFILSLLAIVISAILPALSDAAGDYLTASPYAALAPAIIAAGYALSRSIVKKSRNDASAAAVMPDTVNAAGDVTVSAAAVAVSELDDEPENPNVEVIDSGYQS